MYIMFFVAVIVTYLLSNSITRPIEKLVAFASGMGKGDFTPNDFEFNEVELEDLNAALNKSVTQLGAYDKEQKTFFQNASHELRTPLMSIKVYAEGISFGYMDPKTASETILQETDKLSELVNDLLYIAKMDNITAAHTKKSIDLPALIRECASRQQAVADKNQITFHFGFDSEDISYVCLPEQISRAMDNLISNALRYAKSEILLSCRKISRKDTGKNTDETENTIEITVADDGDGIALDILPHIFERFFKGKGGNTGIGLSIVKSIIEQHNGDIKAENTPNNGAIFTVTLPD